jgi:hypothetical protein
LEELIVLALVKLIIQEVSQRIQEYSLVIGLSDAYEGLNEVHEFHVIRAEVARPLLEEGWEEV